LLLESDRELFGDQPAERIGRTTWREWGDDPDRFVRPILGLRRR
jgi:hypothetical protein